MLTEKEAVQMIEESFVRSEADPARVMRFVGTALVRIFSLQTEDEKVSESTLHQNGMGFSGVDAEIGSSMALFFSKTGFLTPGQVAVWTKRGKNGRPRILKYAKQLSGFVIQKAAQQQ